MKKTAVEWLENQMKKSKHYQQMINEVHQNSTIVNDIFEQAKEMEKEQIESAFNYAQIDLGMEADEYYNQIFKSE